MEPPAGAVPVQALDPGAGRRARSGLLVLVAAVALLAWQPWSGDEQRVAALEGSRPPRSAAEAVVDAAATPTQRPGWPPTPPPRPFAPLRVGTLPQSWGVAAYLERLAGEGGEGGPLSRDLLLKKLPAQAARTPVGDAAALAHVCDPRSPTDVSGVTIASARVRVLGLTVPQEAARARITVRRLGGDGSVAARQVAPRGRRLEAERLRPAYSLFALPRYGPWTAGVYRFEVHLPDGEFRYVYACIEP